MGLFFKVSCIEIFSKPESKKFFGNFKYLSFFSVTFLSIRYERMLAQITHEDNFSKHFSINYCKIKIQNENAQEDVGCYRIF